MDSTYKAQLINKLDTITRLERGGYGLVRKPKESLGSKILTAVSALVAVALFCLFVITVSFI